jgi:hypothetical protein
MKFQQRLVFEYPPEITQKYLTDTQALMYIQDKHPDLSHIEVLEDREEGGTRTVVMKYTTDVSLPGPIKKVLGGAAAQSLVMKLTVDTTAFKGTMEMKPSQMADKIKIAGRFSMEKQGNRWIQLMEGDATVSVFGVGRMIEKFLVDKIQSSSETETRLRNEYLRTVQAKT